GEAYGKCNGGNAPSRGYNIWASAGGPNAAALPSPFSFPNVWPAMCSQNNNISNTTINRQPLQKLGGGLANQTPCPKLQTAPTPSACDWTRNQSAHPGGMNAALGDASVRFVSGNITQLTWENACDPRDGNTLGTDW